MKIRNQQGRRGSRQQHSFAAKAFLRRRAVRQPARPAEPITDREWKEIKNTVKQGVAFGLGLLALASVNMFVESSRREGKDPIRNLIEHKLKAAGLPADEDAVETELQEVAARVAELKGGAG